MLHALISNFPQLSVLFSGAGFAPAHELLDPWAMLSKLWAAVSPWIIKEQRRGDNFSLGLRSSHWNVAMQYPAPGSAAGAMSEKCQTPCMPKSYSCGKQAALGIRRTVCPAPVWSVRMRERLWDCPRRCPGAVEAVQPSLRTASGRYATPGPSLPLQSHFTGSRQSKDLPGI